LLTNFKVTDQKEILSRGPLRFLPALHRNYHDYCLTLWAIAWGGGGGGGVKPLCSASAQLINKQCWAITFCVSTVVALITVFLTVHALPHNPLACSAHQLTCIH
jgi:hypothetical protein